MTEASTGAERGRPVARDLRRASELHRAGRLQEAEGLYRRVLSAAPDHADALHLLGALLVQTGRAEAGLASIERAIERAEDKALYHNSLGLARLSLGDRVAAEEAFRRALSLEPDLAEAHLNLGNLARDRDDLEAAERHFRTAIACAPDYAAAHSNLGNLLRRLGRHGEAVGHLDRARASSPADADILNNLAIALRAANRPKEALERFREAVAQKPDHGGALAGLGSMLAQRNRHEEAIEVLERAAATVPTPEVTRDLAAAHLVLGRAEQARTLLEGLVAADPADLRSRVRLAEALRVLGRFEEALRASQEVLRIDPDCAAALAGVAQHRGAELDPALRERMERLIARPGLPADDQARMQFALYRVYDGLGDPERAFAHLAEANRCRRDRLASGERAFDLKAAARYVDDLVAVFDAGLFRRTAGFGDPSRLPVFIVGMPRSGTTLTEQILASHSEVHGAGELKKVQRLVDALPAAIAADGPPLPYPQCMTALGHKTARRLARRHLASLAALAPNKARVVDKAILNFPSLGLLGILLPGAQVIHCRRDPLDNCFSCFEQDFIGNWPWIWDLESIGLFYRQYHRLMEHWRAVLPTPALELGYERLVAETEAAARETVAFCGLEWEPRCLAFHRTERPVTTASKAQVRQPIYTTSVGKWRRYERHLGPLIEALGDLAERR